MSLIKCGVCLQHSINTSQKAPFFCLTTWKTLQFVKTSPIFCSLPFWWRLCWHHTNHTHTRFLKSSHTKPAVSVNTSENKHSAPGVVSSKCPDDLTVLSCFFSLKWDIWTFWLEKNHRCLQDKSWGYVISWAEQLPAVWKVFSVLADLDLLKSCTATWLQWQ